MSVKSEKFEKDDPKISTSSNFETDESTEKPEKRPFEDPIQRAKILIQYVRLKQKRAQAEMEQKTAIKQRKKDAQESLQQMIEELKSADEQKTANEAKIKELEKTRHELANKLKMVAQKESELKKKREEEEKRKREELELQRIKQAQLEQAQQLNNQLLQHQMLALMAQRAHATPSPVAALASHHRASPYSMLPQQFQPPPAITPRPPTLTQLPIPSTTPMPTMYDAVTANANVSNLLLQALFNQMGAAGNIRPTAGFSTGVPTTEQKR